MPDESAFARQLKIALEGNNRPYFDPLALFDQVRLGVRTTLPLFGNLKESGSHEGGSFLFFLRDAAAVKDEATAKVSSAQAPPESPARTQSPPATQPSARKLPTSAPFSTAGLPSVSVKTGTLAPIGSPYETALKKVAQLWLTLTNGKITMKLYSGGTVGDEADMIQKVRIGQLDCAVLSFNGLASLNPCFSCLTIPLLVRSETEYSYLTGRLLPVLNRQLDGTGFTVLAYWNAGWSYLFSRTAVSSPVDLRRLKLMIAASPDSEDAKLMRELNIPIVPLRTTDSMDALQSGMADAFITSPLTAAANQWFGLTPYMSQFRWGPYPAALVVGSRFWDRVPSNFQTLLKESTQYLLEERAAESLTADDDAVKVMQKYGLKTVSVSTETMGEWETLFKNAARYVLDNSVSPSVASEVRDYIARRRGR